jgi:HSP20 family protein
MSNPTKNSNGQTKKGIIAETPSQPSSKQDSNSAPSHSGSFFDEGSDKLGNTPQVMKGNVPAVNVREMSDRFIVELAAPGMRRNDFKVFVEDKALTISAESSYDVTSEEGSYTKREFGHSSFSRHFTLPENIEADRTWAKYEDGVLRITVYKLEEGREARSTSREVSIA